MASMTPDAQRSPRNAAQHVTPTLHAEPVNAVTQLIQPYDNVLIFNAANFPQSVDLQSVSNTYTKSLQAVPLYTNTNPYTWRLNTLDAYPAWTDVATQLSALEAQVKQLEAALAALRTSLATPAQPAQGGEEKK
ncbi:MAG: hypothetical protein ACREHD_19830 [Pirellulales bacterium]